MPAKMCCGCAFSSFRRIGTVADQQQAGAGRIALDRVEGGQHQRQVFFRRQAADVGNHQLVVGDLPGGAQGIAASCRVEQPGIDAARHDTNAAIAAPYQVDAQLVRGHQGQAAAVVQSPQVQGDEVLQPGEAVVPAVGVEIGVEFGYHRDAEGARGADGRRAERTLR
jgi:hypothetical protein